jgi:serine phosphatase RsbU (regulator of sigma subunit)
MDLLERHPLLATAMMRVLSQRLDATNISSFRDLTEKNRQLQKAYDELKAAQAQLIEKERLERELQLAAEIQLSILPDALPQVPGFDFGARILPARQVGGDFYDVFEPRPNQVSVVIGDVADKGVPSALFLARAPPIMAGRFGSDNLRSDDRESPHHGTQHSTQFVTVLYGLLTFPPGPRMRGPRTPAESRQHRGRLPHGTGMSLD